MGIGLLTLERTYIPGVTDLRVDVPLEPGEKQTNFKVLSQWKMYAPEQNDLSGAMFTPFDVREDRHTLRLITAMAALHGLGFYVNVYVLPSNPCQTTAALTKVAQRLGVVLDPAKMSVSHRPQGTVRVRIFLALGNETHPTLPGIGQVNLYLLQYPFEVPHGIPSAFDAMLTYDNYIVESKFSMAALNVAIKPTLNFLMDNARIFPQFDVVSPWVSPLSEEAPANVARCNVVLLSDLTRTGNTLSMLKSAIQTFRAVLPDLPKCSKLMLLGTELPGDPVVIDDLASYVASQGMPEQVLVQDLSGDDSDDLLALMETALVQWHVQGLRPHLRQEQIPDAPGFDPSIVHGMSAGCIPIVFTTGPPDPVVHTVNGYVASSMSGLASLTNAVFHDKAAVHARLRYSGKAAVRAHSRQAFESLLVRSVHRGILTRPFRYFVTNTLLLLRACALSRSAPLGGRPAAPTGTSIQEHAAVIIEGRCHYALEYVILNTMALMTTGSVHKWTLHVYYTTTNDWFVHKIMADHPGLKGRVKLHATHMVDIDIPAYNHLLKSPAFWEEMLPAQKCLIFQTDSLVLTRDIDRYLDTDYIGAPWHRENERWAEIAKDAPTGVGNGGFSLRDVQASLEISRRCGAASPDDIQEDMFFAHHMTASHDPSSGAPRQYDIAPRAHAYSFCLEVICTDMHVAFDFLPMALHAGWYYNPIDRIQYYLDWSIQNIMTGTRLTKTNIPECAAIAMDAMQ